MPITYTVAIDYDDDGDFSDAGEDITADVLAMTWRLGMARPYDSLADPIRAQITVRNPSRDYSPEATADDLKPGKRLRIQSSDGTTARTHFTGFISHIEPLPGDQGERTAVIHAHGPERQLSHYRVRLPLQVNVAADQVIAAVLDAVPLRRPELKAYWILDTIDHMELGTNTKLAVETLARSLEAGKSTLAYVGDTWADGIPALQAIREVTEAERGRFFINREGQAVFYNRHHTLTDAASDATFDDDMAGLDYAYGVDLVSGVQVRVVPRSIGPAGTTLWELENPLEIRLDAPRRLVARFRDANSRPIGALALIQPAPGADYSANTKADGAGVDATGSVSVRALAFEASAAVLEVASQSKQTLYLLAGARLRGTPLYQGDPMTVEQVDPESVAFYGPSVLAFDLPALTSLEEAEDLARFETVRRKDPRGVVRSIQVDASVQPTQVLARTLFDRVTIRETQTGHDFDYFIVAEEHRVDRGAARHTATWLLESVGFSTFFVVGAGKVGETTRPAY